MKQPAQVSLLTGLLAAGAIFAAGCDSTINGENAGGAAGPPGSSGNAGTGGPGGTNGVGGTGNGTGGGAATAGTGSGTGGNGGSAGTPTGCMGSDITTPKRIVRLLDRQIVNSYTALFGSTAVTTIANGLVLDPLIERPFPPINGEVSINQTQYSSADTMAKGAMAYVTTNPTVVAPSCGAMPTDANCVQQALLAFAEKAWRRPLTDEDKTAITGQFWTEMTNPTTGAGGSVAEGLRFGVYGILMAPQFLYRTEFGADPLADGALSAYEIAAGLSLFITNGPPDAELLAQAQSGALNDAATVRAQARRLVQTDAAKANLETAILGRFDIGKVRGAVITENLVPWLTGGVTEGLKASIFHEGELFVRNTIWSGPLNNLLTSRRTWIRSEMAQIYGVPAPTQLDADMFGPVDLGPERAGLLTLSAFLTSRSRPEFGTSAVARGLAINDAIICRVNPPFPEVIDPNTGQTMPDPEVAAAIAMLATKPENERYQFRITTAKCAGCHAGFDGFGMALEGFDVLGKTRTADLQGRTIDTAWTTAPLPEAVWTDTTGDGIPDEVIATSPTDIAEAVIASGAFNRCFALNFIDFALADVSQGGARQTGEDPTTGCATKGVLDAFAGTDQSFESLIAEIAASNTMLRRVRGM